MSAIGVVINPGALSHYGYALRAAIADVARPTVDVHISNAHKREAFRNQLILANLVIGQVVGLGIRGYEYVTQTVCERWMEQGKASPL